MKTITTMAAQGDILITRIARLPDGAVKQPHAAEVIVAHSETGHHHVALQVHEHYSAPGDRGAMLSYLVASGALPITIEHRRPYDTHETLELISDTPDVGEVVWEIRRQREHTPEGWRRVED
jgi:hypothetical protein